MTHFRRKEHSYIQFHIHVYLVSLASQSTRAYHDRRHLLMKKLKVQVGSKEICNIAIKDRVLLCKIGRSAVTKLLKIDD